MRAKHLEMASDQVEMRLKWDDSAPDSAHIIENEPLRQQRSCARWVFPPPVGGGAANASWAPPAIGGQHLHWWGSRSPPRRRQRHIVNRPLKTGIHVIQCMLLVVKTALVMAHNLKSTPSHTTPLSGQELDAAKIQFQYSIQPFSHRHLMV
jgi:hypothetical protein